MFQKGKKLLRLYAVEGNPAKVKKLVISGVKINDIDHLGRPALHQTKSGNHAVEYLLEKERIQIIYVVITIQFNNTL